MAQIVAQQRVYQSGQPLSSRSPPPTGRTTPVYTSPQRVRVASPVPRRVGVHQVHPQVGQQARQHPQAGQQAPQQAAVARPVSPGRHHSHQHQQQQHQLPQQRVHHTGPAAVPIHAQPAAAQPRRPPSADLPSIGQQTRMLLDHLNGVGGCLASLSRTLAQLVDPSIIDPKSGINATLWSELQQLHSVGEDISHKSAKATQIMGAHLTTVQTLSLPTNTGPSAWGLLNNEDLSSTVSALVAALSHPKLREGALSLPDEEIAALSLSGSQSALGQSNRPSPVGVLGQVNGLLVDSGAQTDPIISIRPTPNPVAIQPARPDPAQPQNGNSSCRSPVANPAPVVTTPKGPPASVPSTIKAGAPVAPVAPIAPVGAPPTPPLPPKGKVGGPPPPPPLPPVVKPHANPISPAKPRDPRPVTPPAQKPKPSGPSLMDELEEKINKLKPGNVQKEPINKSPSPVAQNPPAEPEAPGGQGQIHEMLKKKFANVNRGSIESQASEWSV